MWNVRLSRAAHESLQTLPEEDRQGVLWAIGRLTEGPIPRGLPRPDRLVNRPDLMVLTSGRYRVAYTAADADQAVTVVDIVARDDRATEHPHTAAAATAT